MTLAAPRTSTWRTRAAYWWICLSALAIATFALRPYLTSSLEEMGAAPTALAATYLHQGPAVRTALYLHVFFAGVVLVLSPLQFAARLRARAPRVHRATGRIVLGSIAIAGCAGLVIAPFNRAGLVGTLGFGLLAVLWLTCAAVAFRAIRRGDVPAHRRWMARTFALTYAGVTLRLWMMAIPPVVAALTGVDGQVAWDRTYLVIAFLCWVPNLLVAELYLRAGRRRSRPDDVPASTPSRTPSLHSGGVR
ncbi:DUF2306 domain-containing protein [Geodermatophilus sp. URMC 64]